MKTLSLIFDLTAELLHVEDIGGLLTKVSEMVRDQFGFERVSISILDEDKGVFNNQVLVGYSDEMIAQLKAEENSFEVSEIIADFKPEFKLSKIAYYVPYEQQTTPAVDFVAVRDRAAALGPRKTPDSWHELDLLYFALYDRTGAMIGYLQVDYPSDDKIPSPETISEVELFATIAAVAIENSSRYKRSLDVLKENQVKSERMVRLLELIQSVLRIDDLDVVLQKISDAMSGTFGFRRAGVSLFSENTGKVTVHSLTGYSIEEENKERKSVALRDDAMEHLRDEFRVTTTGYFIPGEVKGEPTKLKSAGTQSMAAAEKNELGRWQGPDLLYFLMHDREGKLLGYIHLDNPLDGLIPTKETMEAMEAFANIATIAIENSATLNNMEKAREEVRMYLDLLTHDVGNLVNPVNAYLEMVIATTTLNSVQHKYISSALEASRSMTHLIRNVRKSAQLLETDRIELVPVNLSRALRQSASDARSTFLAKKTDIRLNLPPQDLWVLADGFLDEVVYNILTNAIKYDDHELVEIDVDAKIVDFEGRDFANVKVSDRGHGIADDLKDKIFSKDFRKIKQERASSQKGKGAGMGLSIVKSLIDRYGGKIWVENRVPEDHTRGSVFNILVPKA